MNNSVTIVIPFWNLDPRMLAECIDSLRTQSEPCDILIVDNCSDRPIPAIPGSRAMRLPRRVSVGAARNAGLAAVTTPYVMFMDADDKLLPGAVAHLRNLLECHPGASLAAGRIVDWVPETGARWPKPWPSRFAHRASATSDGLFRLCNLSRNMTPITGCAVIRTAMAQATGGFPDSTAEDWTFGVAMSFQGRVLLTQREVKLYRWRAQGLSKQALHDLPALLEARAATRAALASTPKVPGWLKALRPLLALVHTLELPFHIRRERIFSSAVRISTHGGSATVDRPATRRAG